MAADEAGRRLFGDDLDDVATVAPGLQKRLSRRGAGAEDELGG
jgi:hypothetical protein